MAERWFQLEAGQYSLKRFREQGQRTGVHVRDGTTSAYVGLSSVEMGSFFKIAGSLNIKYKPCDEPEYGSALCGALVTRITRHQGTCKQCKGLEGPKVDAHGVLRDAVQIIKVAGLQSFTLDGMLSVMRGEQEMLQLLADEYVQMIRTVERFPEIQAELEEAQKKIEDNKKAVSYFLRETHGLTLEALDVEVENGSEDVLSSVPETEL